MTELRKVKSSVPVTQPVCVRLGIERVCPCQYFFFFFKEEKQEFYKMIGLSLNYIFRKVILLFFFDSHLKV